jgi:hypothetical protein
MSTPAIRESPVGDSTADREWKSEIASLGRCTGQATYDRAQFGLLHLFRCFFGRDPLHLTLASLWPLFILAPNFQWEDVHFAKYNATVLKALFVCKRPKGVPANCSNNTSLFERFARSRMMRCFALVWPAFWNDPSSRLS